MPQRVAVRRARHDDLDAIMLVEAAAWPEAIRASRAQFAERLQVHPQGFFVAEVAERIVAALTSQRLRYSFGEQPLGWEKTTNGGWIGATHQASGNALYVVSVGVSGSFHRQGIGTALIQAAQEHARALGLEYVLLDSRLPDYKLHQDKNISVENYVFSTDSRGEPLDPELRFYVRLGFKILSTSQIIPDCMTHDLDSARYGVRMVWAAER